MKKTILLLLTLTTSVSWADCLSKMTDKILSLERSTEKDSLQKLKDSIEAAYKLKEKRNINNYVKIPDIHLGLKQISEIVERKLDRKLNIETFAEAVMKVNETNQICHTTSINSYAEEIALLLKINPDLLGDHDLSTGMNPMFYKKRKEAVLNVGLVYYGDYYSEEDLTRVQALLEQRFAASTNRMLKLKTIFTAIIPFKHNISSYPEYTLPEITDPVRLQRLWYYDNVNTKVMLEVYNVVKASPSLKKQLFEIDTLAIVTGAQFDGLGWASGRVAITENPMDIAWALPDAGSVEYISDAKVVDELLHEIGHTMFLDHTSNQCQKPEMSYEESQECCETSPSKNDVMSYCRKRSKVDDTFYFKYESCNLRMIQNKIIPAMLSGGAWNIANREKCE